MTPDKMDDRSFVEWCRAETTLLPHDCLMRLLDLAGGKQYLHFSQGTLCDMADLRLDLKAAQERIAELEDLKPYHHIMRDLQQAHGRIAELGSGSVSISSPLTRGEDPC